MRNPSRLVIVLCCISSIAACDFLKKKDADAGAAATADDAAAAAATDAAATTPAATTGTGATNENDVARFPDETALASVAATTKRFAFLRESPGNGKVVLSLNAGQAVTELAQRQNFFLVTVDSGGAKKLGWLSADAFTAPVVDAGLHPPTCTAPEVPLMGDAPFCGKVCGGDVDCPGGQACKGTAQRFSATTLLPGTVAVCTVVGKPATPIATATVAPVTPPPLSQSPDITPPPCGPGFTLLQHDKQCHRVCALNVGLKACKLFCIRCENQTVCSNTRACP